MSRPLRIYLCCQQDLRPHPIPAYRFWAPFFRSALAESGHACLEAPGCDWAEGISPQGPAAHERWREATWQAAVAWICVEHKRRPIDLFLSYLYPGQVDAGAVAELRGLGIPSLNFFCDNVRLFRRPPAAFRAFSLNWVPEKGALEMYRRAGMPVLHAPMACWVAPEWRTPPAGETLPPTFVGTRDEQRERLFAEAYRLGLKMDLRGEGWDGVAATWTNPEPGKGLGLLANQWDYVSRHGVGALARKVARRAFPPRPVAFDFAPWGKGACLGDDYWRVLRESQTCIGVSRYPSPRHSADRPGLYSRLRDIEAPMAGAAYLTEFAPGIDDLYDVGEEIEVYRTPAELVSKVEALGRDPQRRRRLREKGQRRALADHGIGRTLARAAEQLGIA